MARARAARGRYRLEHIASRNYFDSSWNVYDAWRNNARIDAQSWRRGRPSILNEPPVDVLERVPRAPVARLQPFCAETLFPVFFLARMHSRRALMNWNRFLFDVMMRYFRIRHAGQLCVLAEVLSLLDF